MPFFSKLAKQSIFFRLSYANAPITLTSHMSMLTGLNPAGHGLSFLEQAVKPLSRKIVTLPSLLKKNGYITLWNSYNKYQLKKEWGFGRGIDYFFTHGIYPEYMDEIKDQLTFL